MTSCTPGERYRVLSVFFDGVPDPDAPVEREQAAVSSQLIVDADAPRVARPGMIPHAPYRDQPCTTCHPKSRSFYLGEDFDLSGRCYGCHEHDDFKRALESLTFQHGPVALGACLLCHDPHESLHPGLLVAPDPGLCYRCHEREAVLAANAHAALGAGPRTPRRTELEREGPEERCLGCHDPHGGESRALLRAPTGEAR